MSFLFVQMWKTEKQGRPQKSMKKQRTNRTPFVGFLVFFHLFFCFSDLFLFRFCFFVCVFYFFLWGVLFVIFKILRVSLGPANISNNFLNVSWPGNRCANVAILAPNPF